jgi:hypothetical protein
METKVGKENPRCDKEEEEEEEDAAEEETNE